MDGGQPPAVRCPLSSLFFFLDPCSLHFTIREEHGAAFRTLNEGVCRSYPDRRHADFGASFPFLPQDFDEYRGCGHAEVCVSGQGLPASAQAGGTADCILVFIEVPQATFNPAKSVYDLLRSEHQPETPLQ